MRCWSIAVAVAIELALRGISLAADPRFPDWPCSQIKVPEISVAARKTMNFVCEVPVLIEQRLFSARPCNPTIPRVRDCRCGLDLSGNGVLGNGSIVVIE